MGLFFNDDNDYDPFLDLNGDGHVSDFEESLGYSFLFDTLFGNSDNDNNSRNDSYSSLDYNDVDSPSYDPNDVDGDDYDYCDEHDDYDCDCSDNSDW